MEKTFADSEADIASLRANASKRRLAEERMAADQLRLAAKLIEVVADFESKAKELEEFVKSRSFGPLNTERSRAPPLHPLLGYGHFMIRLEALW